ncbi:hypothetical protein TNCV_1560531 [Trichonephila clavipes]|nr:hypothetical protein TNCV_1560531 [Trichonephila clavipes]
MNGTTEQEKTTQLVSRNETTQLCTAVDRLQSPATAYNRLHRLYSRIGFFYLLTSKHPPFIKGLPSGEDGSDCRQPSKAVRIRH